MRRGEPGIQTINDGRFRAVTADKGEILYEVKTGRPSCRLRHQCGTTTNRSHRRLQRYSRARAGFPSRLAPRDSKT
jgi:hypothetical protein